MMVGRAGWVSFFYRGSGWVDRRLCPFPIIWRVANGFLLIRRHTNENRTPRATEPQDRSSHTKLRRRFLR